MTTLEQRLGRKLDKRDIGKQFFVSNGHDVFVKSVNTNLGLVTCCFGYDRTQNIVRNLDGSHYDGDTGKPCPQPLQIVRPAINIGDTVRLMPPNGSYYKTEQDREDSFVAEVVSFATAASGQCGRFIAALQEHLGDTPKERYVILEHSSGPIVWEELYVQLVRRKDEAVGFGRESSAVAQQNTYVGTRRFSCKEPNPSNTPKFGSSRIGAGDFVVSFNTRDEYSEREKITMAPLSLGRVAAVSMDGFTMGVELFAVNGNKIDGPSRPHAPYCTAMLRQAGVDEIEKYGGNSESTPPFVVGDYVVHEKIFEKTFSVTPVCKIKRLDGSGSALLQTVRPHSTDNEPYGAMVFLSDLRRPTIDEWHRDCMNELDIGDVVDLVPDGRFGKLNEGPFKGTRVVVHHLGEQTWPKQLGPDTHVFTVYFKDKKGLTYNWPAFALRIVAKKPSKEHLEKLKPTIHSALPDTYEFIDEKRPLKIKPDEKFEAKMKLDADAYIEEELEHLDSSELTATGRKRTEPRMQNIVAVDDKYTKPYNPDCTICHGKGYTEELGGKWPCKDCRPEAHKFVGKTKPEPKPKPYHGTNEFGEVVICAKNHHDLAYRAATVDLNKKRKARNDKAACDLYRAIENMMRGGIVTKAQIFAYAEQAELKIRADEDAAREEFHKKWGKSVMDNPKGEANEGKAAGKTLPHPDGQA